MKKGFTLIELLVVVAIIGILATVVTAALSGSRQHARDARRESDIRAIQSQMELYYLEHGQYPPLSTGWARSNASSWAELETFLGIDLPVDPVNDSTGNPEDGKYVYAVLSFSASYTCNYQAYLLVFNKEGSNNATDGVVLCDGSSYGYGNAFVVGVSPRS